MFNPYYQQQLSNLRTRAAEFARAHPAIAPLLAEASEDPDVERLLEGTAFLTAILQQKIDDDFPEFIHGLTEIIFPHLLRPVPSATVLAFKPKESLLETLPVPAGTKIFSVPIDGTRCEFRTCMDIRLMPLSVIDAGSQRPSTSEEIVFVKFQLSGTTLSQWKEDSLRFYLAGDFSQTSKMFMRLMRSLRKIIVKTPSGGMVILGPDRLSAPGFDCKYSLCPMPKQSFRGYSLLIDYFVFPEKFLFLELSGLSALREKGNATEFEIDFVLDATTVQTEARKEYFTLFATTAVNLFDHEAEPIQVNHESELYPVRPSGTNKNHYGIFTVDSVTGFPQGMVDKRVYLPFNRFSLHDRAKTGIFQVHRTRRIDGEAGYEVNISLSYLSKDQVQREILSVDITCTNGRLPEQLRVGDVCMPTSNSPELATFRNIVTPTPYIDIMTGKKELWHLLSHVSLNLLSLENAESLREFLRLYTFETQRSDHRATANRKRVNAVEEFLVKPCERIVRGILMRGIQINLTAADRNFASDGDLFLFGSVLDAFVSMYSSMNAFTLFELNNSQTGERFQWPPRIGEKPLI